MFYQMYEFQRSAAAPLLATLRLASETMSAWNRPAWALTELLARSAEAGEPRHEPIETVVAADLGRGVEAHAILTTPFVRVVRLRIDERQRPPILLVAPHSGYATTLLAGLVATLLPLGEVWITDWVDARLVPAAAGPFGHADQVAVCLQVMAAAGRPMHLMGLSQSVPVVMAAATLGSNAASVMLLGGPADPKLSPTPLQQGLALLPAELVLRQSTAVVAARHPGSGRRVYPAVFQLLAYAAATPAAYATVQAGLLAELILGRSDGWARQHADMHRLLDVPAELFADTVEHALRTPAELNPGTSLANVPLFTVEAGSDGLIGPGQTHAAHQRLASAGVVTAGRHTVPGADHHDLFTGLRFQQEVAPLVVRMLAR